MAIAEYYLGKKNHVDEVTATLVADLTAGYTPVRIEKLLDEALIIALRYQRTSMTVSDVLEAQLVTEVGIAHEMGYHPDERRRIAIHEAGHALAAVLTRRDVKVASILRRSSALGLVAHGDSEERFLKTPSEARDLIAVALAGRAAEEQEYGEASSGISSDLAAATTIAAQLVGQLGARPRPAQPRGGIDADGHQPRRQGPVATSRAGEAAEALMREGADRAAWMVSTYRQALYDIADGLCASDELDGDTVKSIMEKYTDITERRGPIRHKPTPTT